MIIENIFHMNILGHTLPLNTYKIFHMGNASKPMNNMGGLSRSSRISRIYLCKGGHADAGAMMGKLYVTAKD